MTELNKISVIIPTIQKKIIILERLVNSLIDDESVSEIIVINNKPDFPLDATGVDKLKVITPKENLYVNPSWNLGIETMQGENFVLLNDDVVICKNFCGMIVNSDVFNHPDTGLIGYSPKSVRRYDKKFVEDLEPPEYSQGGIFEPMFKCMHTSDWGIAIFGKKVNYYKIPDEIKVFYGDNYLLYKNIVNKKINYQIVGIPIKHVISSSSSEEEFSWALNQDGQYATKYFYNQEEMNRAKQDL